MKKQKQYLSTEALATYSDIKEHTSKSDLILICLGTL